MDNSMPADSWVSSEAGLRLEGRQLLSSNMVAGVGVGVFVILFFMAFCIILCLLGSRTKNPWLWCTMSAIIFGIIFAVLAASPKGAAPIKPATGYDQTIVPMSIIMSFLTFGIVLGALGMCCFQGSSQVYARPLSYHEDVLGY